MRDDAQNITRGRAKDSEDNIHEIVWYCTYRGLVGNWLLHIEVDGVHKTSSWDVWDSFNPNLWKPTAKNVESMLEHINYEGRYDGWKGID